MRCVYCGGDTNVSNSRRQRRNNQIWRRRKCKACGAIFTSHEAIDLSSTLLVVSGGSTRPFITDILFTEVLLALQDRKDCYSAAREATSTIVGQLLRPPAEPVVGTKQISQIAAKVLRRLDKRAYLRYLAEHQSLQG